jgi:hypothetical protein
MSSASLAPALVRRALSSNSPSTVVLSLVRAMPQSCYMYATIATEGPRSRLVEDTVRLRARS